MSAFYTCRQVELYFVSLLAFDLFGVVEPARSCTPADIALRVLKERKPPHHNKVIAHAEDNTVV